MAPPTQWPLGLVLLEVLFARDVWSACHESFIIGKGEGSLNEVGGSQADCLTNCAAAGADAITLRRYGSNKRCTCITGITGTCTQSLCRLWKTRYINCGGVDGAWSSWVDTGACSVTCASGTIQQSRSCDNPAPSGSGADCTGDSTQTISCDTNTPCPVDGSWSSWSAVVGSTCSTTCGDGLQQESRSCTDPTPQHGGAACGATQTETRMVSCNTQACPVYCSTSSLTVNHATVTPTGSSHLSGTTLT